MTHRTLALLCLSAIAGCQGTITRSDPGSSEGTSADDGAGEGVVDRDGSLGRAAPEPAVRGPMSLRAETISSSRIELAWDPVDGASGYDVWIGAEPGEGDAPIPDAIHAGTVTEPRFAIEGLAARADVFVRVEAKDAGGEWGHLAARTSGGARADLDTPLRAVHGYGPNVLMLVLANPGVTFSGGALSGDLGGSWQTGSWTVTRADGSEVAVTEVHRDSIPVGQPGYPVGFEAWPDDTIVDVDHRIFLVLAEPLGSRAMLRVQHSGSGTELDALVPFSDRYTETPLVQLNQVGYNPRATRRWAYVSGFMGTGGAASLADLPATAEVLVEPIDALSLRRAAAGDLPIATRSAGDAEAGGAVREIDLSTVPAAEGVRYRVRIPGVGVSYPTAVSEEATMRSFYVTARGMYHNRWCGDLDADNTEWSRPADHCTAYFVTGRSYRDTMFTEGTARTGERPVRGGHHDAGDFDIRPYHVLTAQYLLRAFELAPDRFSDGQLSVPESGNGIPDLLDEALYSLAAWQDLQNPDGAIRAGVESYRHPAGIYKADADELPYWTFDPEPWHTAYVAALFAQAARLVEPYDAERAAALETAARAAYASSTARSAPDAHRLFAASELLALTGEASFAADFAARWAALDAHGHGAFDRFTSMEKVYPGSFDAGTAMADYVMGYAQSPAADPAIVSVIRTEILARADEAAAGILESPHAHRNGRDPRDTPDWGKTSSTGRHVDLVYQALELGGLDAAREQRYFDAISVSADYALGANPMGIVYLTGLGTEMPREPLHLDSLAFVKEGMPPVPGIPIYGPVANLPAASYYDPVEAAFVPAFDARPVGRHVIDSRTSVTTAEFTVWESQAPFTAMFAALVAPGMEPPSTWLPGGASHRETLPEHFAE